MAKALAGCSTGAAGYENRTSRRTAGLEYCFCTGQKTVLDYWKTHANKSGIAAASLKIDLKNGYIAYEHEINGGGEFAVWRTKNGTDLIGQTTYQCGPGCSSAMVRFWRADKTEITQNVLPRIAAQQQAQMRAYYRKKSDEQGEFEHYLKFPRVGTTISVRVGVYNDDDLVVGTYAFNGLEFVFRALQ
ncbi:MAG: hypothetical protein ACK41E_06725 [Deinococcales bacterium]